MWKCLLALLCVCHYIASSALKIDLEMSEKSSKQCQHQCLPDKDENTCTVYERCRLQGKCYICEYVGLSCSQPRVPKNAYIVGGRKFIYFSKDRVTFKCKTGFNPEGIDTTDCFMQWWSVRPFRCTRLGCSDPGVPENGNKKGISSSPGSRIFFSCNYGYRLEGSMERLCLPNNTWSGTQPTCKLLLKGCGQPVIPFNAYIENHKPKYASGEEVTFKCKKGFSEEGIAKTFCLLGRWNPVPFRCTNTSLGCGDPGIPTNGNKVGTSYTPGNQVFFYCNIGYGIVGSAQRRCLANNTWSGTQPTCPKIEYCNPPTLPKNAYVPIRYVKPKYTNFDQVTFRCKMGFEPKGEDTVSCVFGQWLDGLTFRCAKKP